VGGLLEKLATPVRTHWKHRIPTPSGEVQVIRRSDGTSETLYVTTDHLGSTDAVLDAAGNAILQGSFAVHGERRAGDWQGPPSSGEWQSIANTTRRGYTGHEMLDNVALIHMNGRVLDPVLGRFLSADPYIDGPLSTQGWNRYAYVHGRVMSATDPSGYQMCKPTCYLTGHNIETIDVPGRRIRNGLEALAGFLNGWAISDLLNRPQTMDTREQEPADPGTGPEPAEPRRLPCSAASNRATSESDILIQVGFTDVGSLPKVNHMLVLATDPATGVTYASRSGPGLGPIGLSGVGPWNTAVSGPFVIGFADYGHVHSVQTVGFLNAPFEDVTAYMDGFAAATNSFVNPYMGVTGNSNSYASRLVEGFGFEGIDPHLSVPGSGGGRVLKEFRCEGP